MFQKGNKHRFKKGQTAWNKDKPAPWAIGNKHRAGKIPWNKDKKVRLNPGGEFKKGHKTWNKDKKGLQVAWNKNII